MELLDLYDDKGRTIGKTIKRGENFNEGNIMLSVIFKKQVKIEKINILQLEGMLFIMKMV